MRYGNVTAIGSPLTLTPLPKGEGTESHLSPWERSRVRAGEGMRYGNVTAIGSPLTLTLSQRERGQNLTSPRGRGRASARVRGCATETSQQSARPSPCPLPKGEGTESHLSPWERSRVRAGEGMRYGNVTAIGSPLTLTLSQRERGQNLTSLRGRGRASLALELRRQHDRRRRAFHAVQLADGVDQLVHFGD